MALELLEQLDWEAPDGVVYPTGGGVGLVGMHKAAHEVRELGWTDELVPMYAAQAAGCAPSSTHTRREPTATSRFPTTRSTRPATGSRSRTRERARSSSTRSGSLRVARWRRPTADPRRRDRSRSGGGAGGRRDLRGLRLGGRSRWRSRGVRSRRHGRPLEHRRGKQRRRRASGAPRRAGG